MLTRPRVFARWRGLRLSHFFTQQSEALRFHQQIARDRRRGPRAVSYALDDDGPGDFRVLDRREADEPGIDPVFLFHLDPGPPARIDVSDGLAGLRVDHRDFALGGPGLSSRRQTGFAD